MKSLREIVESSYDYFSDHSNRVVERGFNFSYELNIGKANYPAVFSEDDEVTLRGVFTELINNSHKSVFGIRIFDEVLAKEYEYDFMKRQHFIRVSLGISDDFYIGTVTDNGPGISPQNMPKIWIPRFSTFGTSGLGLSIIHNKVRGRFMGKIEVFSKPNEETRFSIYIPLGYKIN